MAERIDLTLARMLPAAPGVVFDAWTEKSRVQAWLSCGPEMRFVIEAWDARVGGSIRVFVEPILGGEPYTIEGEFLVVDRPSRLAYTWGPGDVRVEFEAAGDDTCVTVRSSTPTVWEGMSADDIRDTVNAGWKHSLARLSSRVVPIRRVMPNIGSDCPEETRDFYVRLLGMEQVMDLGWITILASTSNETAQVSIVDRKALGTPPDVAGFSITVEVEDVADVYERAVSGGLAILAPLVDEEYGVRRFVLRDPSGTTVNVMSHIVTPM